MQTDETELWKGFGVEVTSRRVLIGMTSYRLDAISAVDVRYEPRRWLSSCLTVLVALGAGTCGGTLALAGSSAFWGYLFIASVPCFLVGLLWPILGPRNALLILRVNGSDVQVYQSSNWKGVRRIAQAIGMALGAR